MHARELRTCEECGHTSAVKVRKPSHVLHAILSLLTCGIWLIVWLIAIADSAVVNMVRKPKCPHCKRRAMI